MGALKGGMTVKRFRVVDGPPENVRSAAIKALRARPFRPLAAEEDEERASGWVVNGRLLDTDFSAEKVLLGDYLALTFRIDTWKVPSATLEAHVQARELELLAESGGDALPRQARSELKEQVRRSLRRQSLPSMKGVDLVWHLVTGRVWVWTHSARVLEEIEGLFEDTFQRRLHYEDPFSAALHLGWQEEAGAPLMSALPAQFAGEA